MSVLRDRNYRNAFLWSVILATMVLGTGAAIASGPSVALPPPTIEHVDGGLERGPQSEPQGFVAPQAPATGSGLSDTELLLVTRRSCRLPSQVAPLSAIPLVGGDRDGEWILLAGLGWSKDSGYGANGPVMIETEGQLSPVNWYFTVEMLFVPQGQWNFRASLAIDGQDLHDAIATSEPQLKPLHIGVAISFDSGDKSPLVLNLGYGRSPLEGRLLSVPSDGARPEPVLAETRIFSACLNIQW